MPIVIGAAIGLGLLIGFWCVQDVLRERAAPRLARCAAMPARSLVSVLIPARDEAARIAGCLAGLARQTYPRFELIVVDDRSRDGTGALVRSFVPAIPALQLLPGAELPPGWAGKPWACWQAAQRARGEWLLFLDADVAPAPDLLAALLAEAKSRQLDLLTAMPQMLLGSPAERLVLPAFMSLLYGLYPLRQVGQPGSPAAFANGQCLLVRRAAYFALDGHRAVRDSILEDTHFGQLAHAAGLRIAAVAAPAQIAVRMYTGWPSLAEGLIKNAVAGFKSGGTRSAFVGLRQAAIAFVPLQLLAGAAVARAQGSAWAPALLGLGAALLLVGAASAGWLARQRYRISALWGLAYPLGLAIYFGLTATALLRLRLGFGVRWKGRVFR